MAGRSFYLYQPSQAVAGVAAALFGISFLVSVYQLFKYRAWVWVFMVIAVGMEAVGYVARTISAGDVTARTIFILQFCLIILAPVLMAGVIYVAFGRIVFHVVPPHARTTRLLWVPPRFITPIFVAFDIFALFLQLVGAVMISGTQVTDQNAAEKLQRGKDIALAGVSTQIAAFGLFTIVAARFHFSSRRFTDELEKRYNIAPGSKYISLDDNSGRRFHPDWRRFLYVVNTSCLMILVRSIYREIEFAMGKGSYVEAHEWVGYVFDGVLMFIVVASYNIWHPSMYLPHMGFRLPRGERQVASQSGSGGEAFTMADRRELPESETGMPPRRPGQW